MKVAICLFGKFTGKNNRGDVQGFEEAYELLKKNIIDDNTDIFFHGWNDDDEVSQKLIKLYNPKNYILERQIIFDHPYKDYNFVPEGPWNTKNYIFNDYSRFYSIKKSLELVPNSYDIILLTRFDTVFYEKIFFDKLDPSNFYVSNWHLNNQGWGFNDAWFISGLKIMKEYSLIYDRLNDYFDIEKGEYIKFLEQNGLGLDSLPSGHVIHKFRAVEMNLQNKIFSLGLEYKTWGLIRRLNQRVDPWGFSGPDINIPTKL